MGLSAIVLCLFGLPAAPAAGTSSVPSSAWSTNGMVTSVLPVGRLLYVGGRFTQIGAYTGSGVSVGRRRGLPVGRFPKIDGSVYAATSSQSAASHVITSSLWTPGLAALPGGTLAPMAA